MNLLIALIVLAAVFYGGFACGCLFAANRSTKTDELLAYEDDEQMRAVSRG